MAINVDENSCSIAIYLYGDSISLDDASKLLGLTPTRSRNRGEKRITSSGSEVVQKIGFWEYRVKAIADQTGSFLAKILNAIECARVVGEAGITKAELDIFYPISAENDQDGFSMEIPSDLLRKAAQLGFDLIVTVR